MIPGKHTSLHLILLAESSVQKELGISASLAKTVDEFADKLASEFAAVAHLAKDLQEKRMAEMGDEIDRFLRSELATPALNRLSEIAIQVGGPLAIRGEKHVTDPDSTALKQIQNDTRNELMAKLSDTLTDPKTMPNAMAVYRKRKERSEAVIGAKTRRELQVLAGAPFEKKESLFATHYQ